MSYALAIFKSILSGMQLRVSIFGLLDPSEKAYWPQQTWFVTRTTASSDSILAFQFTSIFLVPQPVMLYSLTNLLGMQFEIFNKDTQIQ